LGEPEGDKVKATVYRQREPAKTAMDQWRALESEALEEENTERGRFFDLYERLSHAISLIDAHLLQTPDPGERERCAKRLQELMDVLAAASFSGKWVNDGEAQNMTHKEAGDWAYQKLNAEARVALSKAKAMMIALGIFPRETADEAEDKIELEAITWPRTR
jgi:hypothetical protein